MIPHKKKLEKVQVLTPLAELYGFSPIGVSLYLVAFYINLVWVAFATFSFFGHQNTWWPKYGFRIRKVHLLLFWLMMLCPGVNVFSAIAYSLRVFQIWNMERKFKQLEKL